MEQAILEDKAWLNSLRSPDFCCLLGCRPWELQGLLQLLKLDSRLAGATCGNDEAVLHEASSHSWRPKREFDDLDPHQSMIRADFSFRVPERLTMTRLVAIIALGLEIGNEAILISDLLRWTRVMQFPFRDLNRNVSTSTYTNGKNNFFSEKIFLSRTFFI